MATRRRGTSFILPAIACTPSFPPPPLPRPAPPPPRTVQFTISKSNDRLGHDEAPGMTRIRRETHVLRSLAPFLRQHATSHIARAGPLNNLEAAAKQSMASWLSVPAIVLVHGLIGSFTGERTVSLPHPVLVLSPDLLGYGTQADASPESITIEAQVEYMHAAADRAGPGRRVHLAGHSVGGVIAMSFAHRFPGRVASVVNVEGNFTLEDAFWSAQLAAKAPSEVHELLAADRADPARWLREAGVTPTSGRIRSAAHALAYQPATTIQAAARAVVEFTGRAGYQQLLREVFARTPVHLVAGARSRAGWHVPAWALTASASYTEVPGAGHMVMLEAPEAMEQILADLIGDDLPHHHSRA